MTDIEFIADRNQIAVVLVYGGLQTGGIETLIVRLANYLESIGVRTVICTTGGELISKVNSNVEIVLYSDTANLLFRLRRLRSAVKLKLIVMSFDPISLARALAVGCFFYRRHNVVHHSGVFHPRAFFMDDERSCKRVVNKIIAWAVGFQNLFFMNEECRTSHALYWRQDLSSSHINPLPINARQRAWEPQNQESLCIVSIGRLVNFKAYNLGLFDVVKECISRGVHVRWDIFGDGPLRKEMENRVKKYGLDSEIRLMGTLDYSYFDHTVCGYDLFVGMGTAAIEAASLGVPTICALVDDPKRCHGYLYQLPFGNVGEAQDVVPPYSLTQLIVDYSKSSELVRQEISTQCISAVSGYTLPDFVRKILDVQLEVKSSFLAVFFQAFVAFLYWLFVDGYIVNGIKNWLRNGFRLSGSV